MNVGAMISNKYELTKYLGQGGLGRVFLAEQKPMGRKVALKLLHPEFCCEADLAARFEREALAASRVSHPNSVVIHDFGFEKVGSQKQLYLVMEYLSGTTLHDRIQDHQKRRLPAWEAVHILTQVLRPVAAFHRAGVIHRDLKPDNIMLCPSELGEQVKLLDFGIAKVTGTKLTMTGQMVGTPHYMAPEQITAKKDIGPAADIYAMGIMLYEALAGDPPFLAENQMDLFRAHLQEKPTLLAKKFPGEFLEVFDEVIQKAMAKKPADRYQSADEMRLAMEKALVASVAKEQELLEVTQSRKRLTPSLWMEEKTNVRGVVPPLAEENTVRFSVHEAKTLLLQAPVAETMKIQRVYSPEREWLMSPTEPTMMPVVRQPLARVRRGVGFWSRVSKLWRFFKK